MAKKSKMTAEPATTGKRIILTLLLGNVLSGNSAFLVNGFFPSAIAESCYAAKRKRQYKVNYGYCW